MMILCLVEGAMCTLPLLFVFSCSFENVNDEDLRGTYSTPLMPESAYTCILIKAGVDAVTAPMLYLTAEGHKRAPVGRMGLRAEPQEAGVNMEQQFPRY